MIAGIRQRVVVQHGGRIEIDSSELMEGTVVEVIAFVDPVEQDTTDYLFSSEANRRHLLKALAELGNHSQYHYVDLESPQPG